MTTSQFLVDPLRGATPLWRVALFYVVLGSVILNAARVLMTLTGHMWVTAYLVVELIYGTYVVIALYRCAGNCQWPAFYGRLLKLCCLVSLLVAVPVMVYLIVTGSVAHII